MTFTEFLAAIKPYFGTAEIIGYVAMVFVIISTQVKNMNYLVIFQCLANATSVLQYAVRGEMSASGVCVVGAVQTLVIFFFNRKKRDLPVYLIAAFLTVGIVSFVIKSLG